MTTDTRYDDMPEEQVFDAILADPATTYVTYVTVPVKVTTDGHGTWTAEAIDLADDGDPGAWGDTYAYNEQAEGGDWYFNPEAQHAALNRVRDTLTVPKGFRLLFGDGTEYDTWVTVLGALRGWTVRINGTVGEFLGVVPHPDTDEVSLRLRVEHYDIPHSRFDILHFAWDDITELEVC